MNVMDEQKLYCLEQMTEALDNPKTSRSRRFDACETLIDYLEFCLRKPYEGQNND